MSAFAPTISVMIPAYEAEAYLGEAIESVLAQDYRPLEVIVVDDGSTAATGEVARRYTDVRYHRQENAGNGAARNTAVGLATGDLFAFLDADDRLVPNALQNLAAVFEVERGLDVAYAHVREFVSPDLSDDARAMLRPPLERMAGYLPTNMLMRRHAFLAVGFFVTNLRVGTTVDWSAKAAERGLRSVLLDDVLFERRLHATNNGIRERAHRSDYVRVVKAALDRRRAQAAAQQNDADAPTDA
jgi:glycosyltransferase involved in cell wall biosynthesis